MKKNYEESGEARLEKMLNCFLIKKPLPPSAEMRYNSMAPLFVRLRITDVNCVSCLFLTE